MEEKIWTIPGFFIISVRICSYLIQLTSPPKLDLNFRDLEAEHLHYRFQEGPSHRYRLPFMIYLTRLNVFNFVLSIFIKWLKFESVWMRLRFKGTYKNLNLIQNLTFSHPYVKKRSFCRFLNNLHLCHHLFFSVLMAS